MTPKPPSSTRTFAFGLFNQKARWSFSRRGWILLFFVAVASATILLLRLHPFLALNDPIETDVLVVDGWITDDAFSEVVAEFNARKYKKIYTTGGPVAWRNAERFGGTYAGYCAARLLRAGVASNTVISVPSINQDWQRTFQSAVALRTYFETNHSMPKSLNLITLGPHARRTRLLFERALGSDVSIGIISIPRDDYDPKHWWRTSTGVREVISELAAYLYCRFVPSAFTD